MSNYGLAIITLLAVATYSLLYLAYLYALYRTNLAILLKRKGHHRPPHYHHKDILFGSDYSTSLASVCLSGTRKKWYLSQFAKYGKTFETNVWGQRIFQTCDPLNAQSLLTAPSTDVGVGPSRAGLVSWLGPGVFSIDGPEWKKSRDLLKPVFKKTALSDLSRLERHLGRLFDEIEQEGLEVDLQGHFLRMFLDFSIDLLLGEDVNTVNKDFSKFDVPSFYAACDGSQLQVVRSSQPWLVRWWKGWTKTWDRPLQYTQSFISRYVDSAVQDFETKDRVPINDSPAFLDELIREAGTKDKNYLRDQLLNVFMPGRDSVAIMISYVFLNLSRNPAVYAKVREEVLAAGDITYDTLKNLTYTNAVIQESLRLAGPSNGQTARDVLTDITLPRGGGTDGSRPILVPKGSIVYVQIQSLHRDDEAWGPDPNVFRPERWIEESKVPQRMAFEFMPFGGGRRICPAVALAMGELAYITAAFALRFRKIQNQDVEDEVLEEGAIVMRIRNGVQVKLVR